MTRYLLGMDELILGDAREQQMLGRAYAARERPLCLCCDGRPPMYVARVRDRYIVKRMPDTGAQHDPDCGSFEPPAELSGLADLAPSAISEDAETGVTKLSVGFGLSKTGARPPASGAAGSGDVVKGRPQQLGLLAMLHFLWDRAGFSRWTRNMGGKRNWAVIRYHLERASHSVEVKSAPLDDVLLVPETYAVDRASEIAARRDAKLAGFRAAQTGKRRLVLLVGEVKALQPGNMGGRLVVKHWPDLPIRLAPELFGAVRKRFEQQLALWDGCEGCHLMVIATLEIARTGVPSIEELSLMTVNEQWVPFDSLDDFELLQVLHRTGRSFIRSLRYNAGADRPMAAALLTDCRPRAVALYVGQPLGPAYEAGLEELLACTQIPAWLWTVGEPMPDLPARIGYPGLQRPAVPADIAASAGAVTADP
jgi:Protein of unknown function (DUF1173)